MAAFEIGEAGGGRGDLPEELPKVTSPEDIARIYGPRMWDLPFGCQGGFTEQGQPSMRLDKRIYCGGFSASLVDVRVVFFSCTSGEGIPAIILYAQSPFWKPRTKQRGHKSHPEIGGG